MLTLLLLRHAKAEPAVRGDDHARRLAARGENDAAAVGRFLQGHGLRPALALVSSSERTARTFALVAAAFDGDVPVRDEATLYDATATAILRHVAAQPADATCLLVVGHNPGIMEAGVGLAQGGDLAEVEKLRNRFPPGGLAVIEFEHDDWADACAAGGRLDAVIYPDDLAD